VSTEPATVPTTVPTPPTPDAGGPQRPLRADARRNYDQIVGAARQTLLEQGSAASLEEIARRAGVGIGTLYRRFPSRLDLLEAVYREDVDTLRVQTDEILASAEPWPAVERWVHAFLGYAATKRALFTELVEAVGRDSALLTYSRSVINGTADAVLSNGKAAGVVRPDVESTDVIRLIGGCSMMGALDGAQQERVVAIVLAGIRA
jgi:AcrR family transcriptional regulator